MSFACNQRAVFLSFSFFLAASLSFRVSSFLSHFHIETLPTLGLGLWLGPIYSIGTQKLTLMLNAIDSSAQPATGSRSVTLVISAVNFMWYVVFLDVVDPLALALALALARALALAMLIAQCKNLHSPIFSLTLSNFLSLLDLLWTCAFSVISVLCLL